MQQQADRVSTGILALDEILHGGLVPGRNYLVHGEPGTGKTILGLHFLTAGVASGEPTLFLSFAEAEASLRSHAEKMGFDLSNITFLDMTPSSGFFAEVQTYDIFAPAEVEREPTAARIVETVEALKPCRVFIDAITQLRYLTSDEPAFRRYVFSLLRYLGEMGATVLFTSESTPTAPDEDLQFLADGIIGLHRNTVLRWVVVEKLRGTGYEQGRHALRITDDGIHIYPRLMPAVYMREFVAETVSSGIAELDAMLHGGLERGTVTLVSGPVGTGKTTLGLHFMKEAARRGERSVVFLFEEAVETVLHRSEAIGIPVHDMLEAGTLALIPVEPLRLGPEEFAQMVRAEVEARGARVVMIDSVSGYRLALRGQDLEEHLHALSRYLRNMGVTTLMVNETESIFGMARVTERGISYMADNVIFLRYLELDGLLRKVIGILKKRVSGFENATRELTIDEAGIHLGAPLIDVGGMLWRDVNEIIGDEWDAWPDLDDLLSDEDDEEDLL